MLPGGLRVKGIVRRARQARDARRYQVAAALYEEALHLAPGITALHVQCGHMHKEAGDLEAALRHYESARLARPDDADLALQLGHFFKVAGQPEQAEDAYRRAVALRPDWDEPRRELAVFEAGARSGDAGMPLVVSEAPAPELLPGGAHTEPDSGRDELCITRLGALRQRSRWGMLRTLRGVEAIRGHRTSIDPVRELVIRLDDLELHREIVDISPHRADARRHRFVFNVRLDFTDVSDGPHELSLDFYHVRRRTHVHRARVVVARPLVGPQAEASDTVVDPGEADGRPLAARIAALPSIVRPAKRAPLSRFPRAVLVQRADQLGDLACSVPAIRRLRVLFPATRLVGLMTAANADLARTLGLFDDVVVAPFAYDAARDRRVIGAEQQEALRRTLTSHGFDLAIDLGESAESRPLLLLSGAPFLYGFKDRETPWLTAGFELNAHDPANQLEIMSPARKLSALIDGLAAMVDSDQAAPHGRDRLDRATLRSLGLSLDVRYAVLHAGARLAFSRWPHFEALARLLLDETDLTLVMLSDELPEADAVAGPRIVRPTGRLPFDLFDALLSHADLFVGNDSGPKHLAALRGTPVVSLHMARLNWREWGQEGTGSIISRRVPCAGCGITRPDDCGQDLACLRLIRPEEVMGAIRALLRSRSSTDHSGS